MISETLDKMFPDAKCELDYKNTYQLLIAVILSAQTTDKAVNKITPHLFNKYPTITDLAKASDIEDIIREIGLYKKKAKALKGLAEILITDFEGKIPNNLEDLLKLPGVGRKTANVVLSEAFGIPAIAVDTHVKRVSERLKIVAKDSPPLVVEIELMKIFDKDTWHKRHHQLIYLGRYICLARKPKCNICLFKDYCNK